MPEALEEIAFPQRGLFLNLLLLFGLIGPLAKIWSIIVVIAYLNNSLMISPSKYPLIDILSSLPLAVALFGIWRMRNRRSSRSGVVAFGILA